MAPTKDQLIDPAYQTRSHLPAQRHELKVTCHHCPWTSRDSNVMLLLDRALTHSDMAHAGERRSAAHTITRVVIL